MLRSNQNISSCFETLISKFGTAKVGGRVPAAITAAVIDHKSTNIDVRPFIAELLQHIDAEQR